MDGGCRQFKRAKDKGRIQKLCKKFDVSYRELRKSYEEIMKKKATLKRILELLEDAEDEETFEYKDGTTEVPTVEKETVDSECTPKEEK